MVRAMQNAPLPFSDDQAEAWDRVSDQLRGMGIDLHEGTLVPAVEGKSSVLAVIGKAGSGKTMLLSQLYKALQGAGVDIVSGDYEGKKRKERRTLAILAPTNKAASVLRMRGVPATTIHRILYTPVYDPQYELIAEWLAGNGKRPEVEGLTELALDRAKAFYDQVASIPGALAAAGLRGSDFIKGWKRREEPLDVGFVDESSMLDERQFEDLKEIFPTLVLFGDPAQLAPVGQSGSMVFDHRGDMLMRAEQFDESLSFIDIAVNESSVASDVSVIEISQSTRASGAQREGVITPNSSDMEQVFGALVLGTRDYVRKNGFTDVVIGLSGGIDSALVAAIAVEALGAQHVHGVSMPSRYSSEGSRTDAALLASNLGIEMQTISIEPAFAAYLDMTAESFAGKTADLTEENLQSRVRGTTLMALSNKFGWMVLTTGNKSELAVGYFTLYGDSVGGYAVIKDLLKTTVYELCRFVNVRAGREVIPEAVIIKPPSAELRPDQRDDQSLPPYEVLDPILELYVEQDRTAAEIIALGFDDALVRRISRLVDMNEYKRRQGPPGVRVSLKAFGKDRRLPITNAYRG